MTNCINCNNPIADNYCANCGQPAKLKRIDRHYIYHELLHLLHFEKGFLYNAKELLIRPGDSIREYIQENRSRHMKPVGFLILTSLLFTVIAHFLHTDEIYNEKENLQFKGSSIETIMHWVQTHYGYANLILGFFYAICISLFFRKYKYNFYEITVMLCFVMGQGMLLLAVENFIVPFTPKLFHQVLLTIIAIGYPTWVIGQFFDKSKPSAYIRSFFAYILGYTLFYMAIIVVGLTTDIILKTQGLH